MVAFRIRMLEPDLAQCRGNLNTNAQASGMLGPQ